MSLFNRFVKFAKSIFSQVETRKKENGHKTIEDLDGVVSRIEYRAVQISNLAGNIHTRNRDIMREIENIFDLSSEELKAVAELKTRIGKRDGGE